MNIDQLEKSTFAPKLKGFSAELTALRNNAQQPLDISLVEYANMKNTKTEDNLSMSAILEDLGIDPSFDTIDNIFTTTDVADVRWIVPEIWREAIRLGIRKTAIWPNLVASEQTISQTTIKMPYLNMMDAMPKKVAEAETMSMGSFSYGSKQVSIGKFGRGIQLTYEMKQYVSLNLLAMFLQDLGVKMGMGLDSHVIDVLLNGDQADGSESAPVIGVATTSTLAYKDMLKIWVRMSRLGRVPTTMVGGETIAVDMLDMDEFKLRNQLGTTQANLTVKTPVPQSSNLFIHGSMPADQILMVDPSAALVKFNARPIMVESEKIISNQTEQTFVSFTTGFGTLFQDSRLILDRSVAFGSNGFPAYMDIDAYETADTMFEK